MTPTVSLSPDAFDAVFPFHLVLDRSLCIVQAGRVTRRLLPQIRAGDPLHQHFTIARPPNIASFDEIVRSCDAFFLLRAHHGVALTLKGQMLPIERSSRIAYLASPWISSLADLDGLQLSLRDFAVHDATGDLLFLLQARTTHAEELQRLAAELADLNASLERRVEERTRALTEANAQLAASEARYRALFQNSPHPVWVYDLATLQILEVNETAVERYGYSRAEFLAMRLPDLEPAGDGPRLVPEAERGPACLGHPGAAGGRHRLKSGEIIDVEITAHPLTYEGRPARLVVAEDITERRRAEQTRRLLATIVESSDDAIISNTIDGTIVSWSKGAERLFGFAAEEAIGRHISLTCPADQRAEQERLQERARRGERVVQHETVRQRKDGSRVPISITISPVRDETGRIIGISAIARDISERIQSERARRDIEERTQFALDAARVGTWEVDLLSGRAYWSERCEAIHGMPAGSFGGTFEAFLDRVHPDDRAAVVQAIEEAVRERRAAELEYRTAGPGGARYVRSTARFFYDEAGTPVRGAGIVTDISEQAALEEQLRHAQKMEALGQLAGGLAHDFNNLLTVILGNAAFLYSGLAPDDERRRDVEEIQKAGERAAQLTRQLLAFSRKQILEPRLLNIGDIVLEMDPMLRRLLGERIDLETVAASRWLSRVDPGQVEQIVLNLVLNARDAMPEGGRLTIETADVVLDEGYTREHAHARPGPYVLLAVTDTGHGMDAATTRRVFEPFFTTKPKGRGTGLGLSTVYGIVKQSGGDIQVYSEVGVGTTFKIYLPGLDPVEQAVAPGVLRPQPLRGRETVLVVEDESIVRDLVCRSLRQYGYVVHAADCASAAVQQSEVLAGALDLIVTDVVLPESNGRDVATRIVSRHPHCKVLYISGYTDGSIVRHGVLEPGVSFLQKPFTAEVLARKVRDVLDQPASAAP